MNSEDNVTQGKKNNMSVRQSLFLLLVGAAVAIVGMTVFFKVVLRSELVPKDKYDYYTELDTKYGKYYEIEKLIESKSIYEFDRDKLNTLMIDALVKSVPDEYIEYFTEEEYEKFNRLYSGSYTGIGVAVTDTNDNRVIIRRVVEDGPAAKAGLEIDDIIVKVDGAVPHDSSEASDMIRGEAGTKVEVVVDRGGDTKTFEIVREDVKESSVASLTYDDKKGIGYVKIMSFKTDTAKDFETAVKGLVKDGCDKIIIDIRENGGGIVNEGVDAADAILPACKIMTAKDAGGEEHVFNSDESMVNAKYVVLIDNNTASASEIFAGAIKDNSGGVLIGTTTYGKGLIQGVYKLEDKSRLKLTIEEYYLPNGEAINKVGVEPDIEAEGEAMLDEAVRVLMEKE